MNLQHLEYFIAIAENKSVSKAAEELYITQPTLSRILKSMEAEMGVPLFKRTAKGVEVTESGEELYQTAKRVVDMLSDVKHSIKPTPEPKHTLKIYAAAIGQSPLDVINEFRKFHPSIVIDYNLIMFDYENFTFPCSLSQENTIIMVPEMKKLPSAEDYQCVKYEELEACAILPKNHRLANRSELRLDEISEETFILPSKMVMWHYVHELFQNNGFVPKVEKREVCEEPTNELKELTNAISLIYNRYGYPMHTDVEELVMDFRDMVLQEHGDILMMFSRESDAPRAGILRIPVIADYNSRWFYMIWSKHIPMSKPMELFADFVVNYYKK